MRLVAKTPTERQLLALIEHAPDPTIRDNIAALPSGDPRTLAAAWRHCVDRAREHLHGHSGGVEDAVVLDWLAAYYAGPAPKAAAAPAPAPAPARTPKTAPGPAPRTDGLILFGGPAT